MRIGSIVLPNALFVAPMAGVTDRPFRMLCRSLGAGHAVSEMVTSKRELWHSLKTSRRADHTGEPGAIAVQIAGVEPAGDGRRGALQRRPRRADHRHQHGLPGQEGVQQVGRLGVDAATSRWRCASLKPWWPPARRCGVPVTLKMRSGWCASRRNALPLARAAEAAGVAMVTVHGRTREQGYGGSGRVRHRGRDQGRALDPRGRQRRHRQPGQGALEVLQATGCRRADDRPRGDGPAVDLSRHRALPGARHANCRRHRTVRDVQRWLIEHLHDHHALYGEFTGVRSARKHIGWVVQSLPGGATFQPAHEHDRQSCATQVAALDALL
jgi:tRNA-dihydrouridine synthase B